MTTLTRKPPFYSPYVLLRGQFSRVVASLLLSLLHLFISDLLMALQFKRFNDVGDSSILFNWLLFYIMLSGLSWLNTGISARLPWTYRPALRFVLQLVAGTLWAGLLVGFANLFFDYYIDKIFSVIGFNDTFITLNEILTRAIPAAALAALVVLTQIGLLLIELFNNSAVETERFKQENITFRYEMLRNQVNPHFLFNSLNTLASLVYENPDQAAAFVRQMARVYRYVLENREREWVTISEELEFLESYLFLVRIRFAEGLQVDIDVPDAQRRCGIAPISLQLLLENAIKHNIVSATRPLHITLTIENDYLVVSNNLQLKTMPEPSTSTGLDNIKNRYAYLTTKPVEILPTETHFTVRLPLVEAV